MVNKFTGFIRTVFVDNGKSWRVDDICYPQLFAYSFDKCCFTGSHLSVESKTVLSPIAAMNCLAASWIEPKELILISISIGLIEFLLFAKVHAFPILQKV